MGTVQKAREQQYVTFFLLRDRERVSKPKAPTALSWRNLGRALYINALSLRNRERGAISEAPTALSARDLGKVLYINALSLRVQQRRSMAEKPATLKKRVQRLEGELSKALERSKSNELLLKELEYIFGVNRERLVAQITAEDEEDIQRFDRIDRVVRSAQQTVERGLWESKIIPLYRRGSSGS